MYGVDRVRNRDGIVSNVKRDRTVGPKRSGTDVNRCAIVVGVGKYEIANLHIEWLGTQLDCSDVASCDRETFKRDTVRAWLNVEQQYSGAAINHWVETDCRTQREALVDRQALADRSSSGYFDRIARRGRVDARLQTGVASRAGKRERGGKGSRRPCCEQYQGE